MEEFYNIVRQGVFNGRLSTSQVQGIETLLKATKDLPITHRAYLLATVVHETAFTMQPIHERGNRSYFDKYEPNTRIGIRLGNTRPGDGFLFRGRGYVQLTGRANYLRASQKLGKDFILNPELTLVPEIAAEILVRGCTEGWFTGKKLDDYFRYRDMRRVVNGVDAADKIAQYAVQFEKALSTIKEVKKEETPAKPPQTFSEPPKGLKKMTLVNQPSLMPTRKLLFAAIAGAVVGGFKVVAESYFPGSPAVEELAEYINMGTQWIIMVVVAYMTKNAAPVVEEKE